MDSSSLECWRLSSAQFTLSSVGIFQKDGVSRCVSPGFQLFPQIFQKNNTPEGDYLFFRENGFQWSAVRNPESCQLNTEHRQLCPFGTLPLFKFDESDWLIWAESIRPAVGRVGFLVWSDPESMEGCLEVQTTA
ncbi:MAG: hypothetical protein CL919_08375 [Deltaproteobacteria bacterium]|nr:hypothetical protein [Deltaproteobacteria bacterium]